MTVPLLELEPANLYAVTIGMADLNNDVTYEGWGKTSTACHIENVSLTWPHPVLQYFGYLSCDGPCSNLRGQGQLLQPENGSMYANRSEFHGWLVAALSTLMISLFYQEISVPI